MGALKNLYPNGVKQVYLDHRFTIERMTDELAFNRSRPLTKLLYELVKSEDRPRTSLQRKIHSLLSELGGRAFSVDELRSIYARLSKRLNQKFIMTKALQPASEEKVINFLEGGFKRKIHPSLFVGPYQYDAVIYAVQYSKLPCLFIEVNGGSHLREGKMAKDERKEEYIVNIIRGGFLPIEVKAYYKGALEGLPEDLSSRRYPDSRCRHRLENRVNVETLANWAYLTGGKRTSRRLVTELLGLRRWKSVEKLIGLCK